VKAGLAVSPPNRVVSAEPGKVAVKAHAASASDQLHLRSRISSSRRRQHCGASRRCGEQQGAGANERRQRAIYWVERQHLYPSHVSCFDVLHSTVALKARRRRRVVGSSHRRAPYRRPLLTNIAQRLHKLLRERRDHSICATSMTKIAREQVFGRKRSLDWAEAFRSRSDAQIWFNTPGPSRERGSN
jgi:hypothetical protein